MLVYIYLPYYQGHTAQ